MLADVIVASIRKLGFLPPIFFWSRHVTLSMVFLEHISYLKLKNPRCLQVHCSLVPTNSLVGGLFPRISMLARGNHVEDSKYQRQRTAHKNKRCQRVLLDHLSWVLRLTKFAVARSEINQTFMLLSDAPAQQSNPSYHQRWPSWTATSLRPSPQHLAFAKWKYMPHFELDIQTEAKAERVALKHCGAHASKVCLKGMATKIKLARLQAFWYVYCIRDYPI